MSDAKAIERAESYKTMMNMWAFKDFELFLKDERQRALETGIVASSIDAVQVNRGKVQQIDSILAELDSIVGRK